MDSNKETIAQRLNRAIRRMDRMLKSRVAPALIAAAHWGYSICYVTGVQILRVFRLLGKRMARLLAPVGRLLYKGLDFLVLRHLWAIGRECRRFGQGFSIAADRVKAAYRRHPLLAVPQALLLPLLAVKRHRRALVTIVNLAAPVAAAFLLFITIQYWNTTTFALALEIDGQTVGYISDEAVFAEAADMAAGRVINTDNSFEVKRAPKLTIAVAPKTELMDESAVCDKILESAGDSIETASGLYIDGTFQGAVTNRTELDGLLSSILGTYKSGAAKERAEFIQNVKIVDGLYPISTVVDASQMKAFLTSQTVVEKKYTVVKGDTVSRIASNHDMTVSELRALNTGLDEKILVGQQLLVQRAQPFLRVQVVRTIEYDQTIAYKTIKEQNTKQYVGYQKVKTKGQNGSQHVVAEVTLVDGVEQSRTVLSTTVTKAAVDNVIVVGAKKYNKTPDGNGISTGRFVWPIPAGRVVSSPFGYRGRGYHAGVDLSGGVFNKPVIAADGGTVVETCNGWGGGYGRYVIIDHGGGYRTVYAHLNTVLVRNGQKVTQSQIIGRAGSSGASSGPHLHFEIRINGRSVNPLPYIK